MKDLIAKMLAALPAYARQLIELLSAPKNFVKNKNLDSPTAITQALTFFAISFALAAIAQIPFLPQVHDKEVIIGVLAIVSGFGLALNVAILALSWKIVGGKLAWKKYLVSSCYVGSVSSLLFLGVFLLAAGIFSSLDPVLYKQVSAGVVVDLDDWSASYKAYLIILGVGFLAVYIWILGVWGAYRKLNQLSRWRSVVAFAIFFVLSLPTLLIQMFMGGSLFSFQPAQEPLPAELVGTWERIHETSSDGVFSSEAIVYRFLPEGAYLQLQLKSSMNGQCLKTTQHGASGRVTIKGTTLSLTSKSRNETIDEGCSGKRSESPWEEYKTVEVYQYQIHKSAKGWELCLNGRFGEVCLTPKH